MKKKKVWQKLFYFFTFTSVCTKDKCLMTLVKKEDFYTYRNDKTKNVSKIK